MKKLLSLLLVTLLLSCITTAAFKSKVVFEKSGDSIIVGRTYEKVLSYSYDIPDFDPLRVTVPVFDVKPTQNPNDPDYFSAMEKAVGFMQKEDYRAAIDLLEPVAWKYDDDGIALYNLGVSYSGLKDNEKAVRCLAWSYAAGCSDAFRAIDNLYGQIGFAHLEKKNYGDAIRYFKTAPANEQVSMNVIFSYMELAKTLPHPKNLIMLLYAGNYIVDNGVRDPNILSLGAEIGKQLGDTPLDAYLPNAIAVLEYLVNANGYPWLNVNLGMLYEHAGRTADAAGQFETAMRRAGKDKEVFLFASGRLVEAAPVAFAYNKQITFNVAAKGGDVKTASWESVCILPQNLAGQTVSGLTVTLNGKPVEYAIVKDRYHAEFASIKGVGLLKPGENILAVNAQVKKAAHRFPEKTLAGFAVSGYDRKSRQYQLYTESSKIYTLSHPLVKKAVADIRKTLKKNDLLSTVNAVYQYVMAAMSYELYDNKHRPKEQIIDRLQTTNGVGLCEDYAVFTATVLRAFGIPALAASGPTFNSEIGHAWPVFFTPRFDEMIVLDTTWGDTSRMPNYYFLFATNQNVLDTVAWDSDILPGAQSFSYRYVGDIQVEMKDEKSAIIPHTGR